MSVLLSIFNEDIMIGYAQIETKGRYWDIVCKFTLPESGRYFAQIVISDVVIPLGLLPLDGHLQTFKPIIKDIRIDKGKISVHKENIGIQIDSVKPFQHINQLPQARLRQLNRTYYITFTDQAQVQPGNDQNR